MATDEPEIATKAPESDAAEQSSTSTAPAAAQPTEEPTTSTTTSPIPGDTPAQTGRSMGEHCVSDRPVPAGSAAPSGEIIELNGVQSYVSKPPNYPQAPGKLLLLLTGGTGLHSVNNQLQADAFASCGYLVVMPDQFDGDAAPNTVHLEERVDNSEATMPDSASSLLARIKEGVADAAKSFRIDMWLARHGPERVLPVLQRALAGARDMYADAVAAGGGVYGVGYCFGAKYILLLAGKHPEGVKEGRKSAGSDPEQGEAESAPELKVGAIAHGTLVTKEDVENVKSPVAMACVENDNLFPDDVREQGRAALELNGVEHEIRVFSGAPHGFAVLGDYKDEGIRAMQVEAFDMMSAWLDKY